MMAGNQRMGLLGVDDESDLIESSKSPASIAWSNKQWLGLVCIRSGTSHS